MDVRTKTIDLVVVSNFIPKMGHPWDIIGIQLKQEDLVKDLGCIPNYNARRNCTQVLLAAMDSECPPNYGTLCDILRSNGVNLPRVATDLLHAAEKHEREKERMQQLVADRDSQLSSSSSTPPDDSEEVPLV